MFDTVAVAGVGLIGGSLGMALRERRLARRVVGIARREATVREALAVGAIDEGSLDSAAAAGADLVVLAPPVLTIPALAEAVAPHLRPGALVTDVGSTKAHLMRRLSALLPPGIELIGGHPMAGSERGGVRAGRADLFEGAVWVLTPAAGTPRASVDRLAELVTRLGATPVELGPEVHDAAVARISHLPHVAAAALAASTPGEVPTNLLRMLAAGGFKSTTRIAASPPELWRDICLTNREAVLAALAAFEAELASFRAALESATPGALEEAFARGKAARDALVPPDELEQGRGE